MVRKYIVTGALLALVIWLEMRRRGGKAAPIGNVLASSYVTKNGACYRVDIFADGSSSSSPADQAHCAADVGPGDLADTVIDPDLGFNRLIHLFDDFDF